MWPRHAGRPLLLAVLVAGQLPAAESGVEVERAVHRALARSITLQAAEKPLEAVIDEIGRQTGAQIQIQGLPGGTDGVGSRALVTCNFHNLALKDVLQQLLDKYDCA